MVEVGEVGVRDGLVMAFGVNENYEDRSPNNTITGTNCILRIYMYKYRRLLAELEAQQLGGRHCFSFSFV